MEAGRLVRDLVVGAGSGRGGMWGWGGVEGSSGS